MSFLSSQYVAPSLNGIIELTDGDLIISNGRISQASHIETDSLTINNTINVPEIITSNIQTQTGSLVIGDINDNITIYGNDIKLVGNVIGYDSANVYIVDNRIELNSGGGNILLPDSGISVLGDGNIAVSSILTDNNGDWIFSSPNNIVSVGTLKAGNVEIDNISFDNLSSANIIATNKFFSPERIITDRSVNRTSAISHLNAGDIKCNFMSFVNQERFRIEFGTTATVNTSVVITFKKPFNSPPTVIALGYINSATPPLVYVRDITNNDADLYAKNTAGNYGNLRFTWMAIGY